MSLAGARAVRRREVREATLDQARLLAAAGLREMDAAMRALSTRCAVAEEQRTLLLSVVNLIATGNAKDPRAEAQRILDQLGIVPDVDVLDE